MLELHYDDVGRSACAGRRASPSVALSRVKTRRDGTWARAWSFMWLGDIVMSPPNTRRR